MTKEAYNSLVEHQEGSKPSGMNHFFSSFLIFLVLMCLFLISISGTYVMCMYEVNQDLKDYCLNKEGEHIYPYCERVNFHCISNYTVKADCDYLTLNWNICSK